MLGQDQDKVYFVKLEFPVENGAVVWKTHVTAGDEDEAAESARVQFWAQMDYRGDKPLPEVREIYEDETAATQFTTDRADEGAE